MMRLFEMLKITDGDCALRKVEGGYLQGIEGDRIRQSEENGTNEHGLIIDAMSGRTEAYAVHNRTDNGGFDFAGLLDAAEVAFDGYFGRFDQTRGISPLAAALNMCTDAHEAFEWTQLKIKFHAILGLQINRATTSEVSDGFPTTESLDYDTDSAGTTTAENRYEFDPSGLTMFDMDPGESVAPIESNTPAQEFTDYSMLMIRLILLALDIPYTAFDSMSASFSARIADREEYEKSAQHKRQKNCEVLEECYEWIIGGWWGDDSTLRRLATSAGIATPAALNDRIEWTGQSTPWLDKLKEVNGDAVAIANGLDSRSRIVKRRHGVSFEDIARELAAEENLADELALDLVKGNPGQQTIGQIETQIEDNADE
jgi:capsid protein